MVASSGAVSQRMPTQTTGNPRPRAFSANTIGKRPLPASKPMGLGDTVRCASSASRVRQPSKLTPLRSRARRTEYSVLATAVSHLPPVTTHQLPLTTHSFPHAQLLLDPLHILANFRQLLEGHEDAFLFALRRGRGAEHAQTGRN